MVFCSNQITTKMGAWGSHFLVREKQKGVNAVVIVLELLGGFSIWGFFYCLRCCCFFLMCCLNRYIFHFLRNIFSSQKLAIRPEPPSGFIKTTDGTRRCVPITLPFRARLRWPLPQGKIKCHNDNHVHNQPPLSVIVK